MAGPQLTDLNNEADVEQKLIYPLLVSQQHFGIPTIAVHPKEYLAPSALDKQAGKQRGYFPDYSVWLFGLPVMVVEAKDPEVAAEEGFREACLYARHLNSRYSSGRNPCRFVLATNGVDLLAGYWDQQTPEISAKVADLHAGTSIAVQLRDFCSYAKLSARAKTEAAKLQNGRGTQPISIVGNDALINSKKALNHFAAPLSPMLRRYFTSSSSENVREIAERAYVSSTEITEYDRVLEALLKDRGSPRRDSIVERLTVQKRGETSLSRAIGTYLASPERSGQLQIIQGAVGAGKSLFARRYRELLQPEEAKTSTLWAFVDFNEAPPSLVGCEGWLCRALISSIEKENPDFDLYEESILKGVFSRKIQQRRAYYTQMRKISEEEEIRSRAIDIAGWQSDPVALVEGLGDYFGGVTSTHLVVVMDNVDKRDTKAQLDAFQLTLWAMAKTRAFVILQMRDETFERFKGQPPLDTYRSAITFHIAPPRFIDVVKKRLELGIDHIGRSSPHSQEYTLDNGMRVRLPPGEIGRFLTDLYHFIFARRTNIARVLEALSGKDVRRALDMFASIITSGHLSSNALTSSVRGAGEFQVTEYHLIRTLMRTDYRFFSDKSGYIGNIFHYDNEWKNPDNFLVIEALYYLCLNRKRRGELGLEGYFSVERVCGHLQKIGYDREDAQSALLYALGRGFIQADHLGSTNISLTDSVRIQASGFIHLRVLCERIEYLYGVLSVTRITDPNVATRLSEFISRENDRGDLSAIDRARAVEAALRFFHKEHKRRREGNPFFDVRTSGAVYVLNAMDRAVGRYFHGNIGSTDPVNPLDIVG